MSTESLFGTPDDPRPKKLEAELDSSGDGITLEPSPSAAFWDQVITRGLEADLGQAPERLSELGPAPALELDPRVNPLLAAGDGGGRPPFVPGLFHDLAAATYHAIEALGSGGAKKLATRSAAHYLYERTVPKAPTEVMQFGTVVHAGVLEPDMVDELVILAPAGLKRPTSAQLGAKKPSPDSIAQIKAWQAFEREAIGKIVFSTEDFARARQTITAIREHRGARRLLAGAKTEVSMFWIDEQYQVPCKLRTDALNFGGIVDLKVTEDASAEAFARTIVRFLYHLQAAHYSKGHEAVLGEWPEFFAFIAAEPDPPHGVACYTLPAPAILKGAQLRATACERYALGINSGEWPCYPDTVDVIQLPAYALRSF